MNREDIARVAKAHKLVKHKVNGELDYPDKLYEFAEAITFFAGNDYHQLIKHLVRGLIAVKTRPAHESAVIAAEFLHMAEKHHGLLECHK